MIGSELPGLLGVQRLRCLPHPSDPPAAEVRQGRLRSPSLAAAFPCWLGKTRLRLPSAMRLPVRQTEKRLTLSLERPDSPGAWGPDQGP